MTPTEHELTVANEAIARALVEQAGASLDDLGPMDKLKVRESALPLTRVALEALPDRAAAIILRVQEHCCTCHNADHPHEDWCPASAIQDELT